MSCCGPGERPQHGTDRTDRTDRAVRFAAFDIETQRLFRDGEQAGDEAIPLTAVALCTDDTQLVWEPSAEEGALSERVVRSIIEELWRLTATHVLVTWSGTNADWPLLAAACGNSRRHVALCGRMALFSVDVPLVVLAHRGSMVGLEACAMGMGLDAGKPIASATAPQLWAQGQRPKVVALCVSDAAHTLEIANQVQASGTIRWRTKKGRAKALQLTSELHTLLAVACPDVRPLPRWRWNLDITPCSCFQWMRRFPALRIIFACDAPADAFLSVPKFDEWLQRKAAVHGAPSPPSPSPSQPRPQPHRTPHGARGVPTPRPPRRPTELAITPIVVPGGTPPSPPCLSARITAAARPTPQGRAPHAPRESREPRARRQPWQTVPPAATRTGRLFAAAVAGIATGRR